MQREAIQNAAQILWQHWNAATRVDALPESCRPANRAEGYAIQAEWTRLADQPIAGWKIAATSVAGQKHIGVDGPIAGRLLQNRVLAANANISLTGNFMRLAEAEFAFRFGAALPKRKQPYELNDVLDAVVTLHCAIEIPDTRYNDVARVGAPQLIADDACACWFLAGEATTANWRAVDLTAHSLTAVLNNKPVAKGVGGNALGDPRIALTWLANELNTYADGLQPGDIVTTGTCIVPVPIAAGDHLRIDFGVLGTIEASFR